MLVIGIMFSVVDGVVLGAGAVRALGGHFDNSLFAVVCIVLALIGPGAAALTRWKAGRLEMSTQDARRREGRVLTGFGLPVLVLSLFLLVV